MLEETAKRINDLVTVWWLPLRDAAGLAARFAGWMSDDEWARADRFKADIHRHRYLAARGALRMVIGRVLGRPPAAIVFTQVAAGKPALAGNGTDDDVDLAFNLSRTDHVAAIAITRRRPVGLDIEGPRTPPDVLDLARRFFAPAETAHLERLHATARPAAFLAIWTAKEAFVKGTGLGLSYPLNAFRVSFGPDGPVLHDIPPAAGPTAGHAESWSLAAFRIPPEPSVPAHVGAVAVPGPPPRLDIRRLDPSEQ